VTRTTSPARSTRRIARLALIALLIALALTGSSAVAAPPIYRIDHVTDGDTVVLRNGQRVRLVQIDTPEMFFGAECYGRAASLRTKLLLPAGTRFASSLSL
jgi:endonuclease YncB( thermonuclease family)